MSEKSPVASVTNRCSFCGVEQSPATPLIAGAEGSICEA
jgi:hypothetical protein